MPYYYAKIDGFVMGGVFSEWTKETAHSTSLRSSVAIWRPLEVDVTAFTWLDNGMRCTKLVSTPHYSLPFAFGT